MTRFLTYAEPHPRPCPRESTGRSVSVQDLLQGFWAEICMHLLHLLQKPPSAHAGEKNFATNPTWIAVW